MQAWRKNNLAGGQKDSLEEKSDKANLSLREKQKQELEAKRLQEAKQRKEIASVYIEKQKQRERILEEKERLRQWFLLD